MTQGHGGVNGAAQMEVLDRLTPPPRVRVLVVHAGTRTTIGGVLRRISDAMRAHDLDVDVVPARSVRDVQAYDAVLVGSAVLRRRWHRHARRFVRRHATTLATRPVWLFSCLEPGQTGPRAGAVRGIRRMVSRLEARGHEVFDPSEVTAVSPFVARSAPDPSPEDATRPSAAERWGDRVGGSIAWEHHVRRDVIRGTAM
jgi:menaquinone-dependent protoporphyrinogen oxidase